MGHATSHHPEPGATHVAVPLDPERDIDAKSTSIWVLASAVVLFLSLYFMLPLFDSVLNTEIDRKIYNAPTTELNKAREEEGKFLRPQGKKSIEQVMQEMATK